MRYSTPGHHVRMNVPIASPAIVLVSFHLLQELLEETWVPRRRAGGGPMQFNDAKTGGSALNV